MDSTSQNIYDVLYEADEPLDADTLVARTWERATSGAQGYALRKERDARESRRRYDIKHGRRGESAEDDRALAQSPREIWARRIRRLLGWHKRTNTLLVDDQGRFHPNPAKPPRAERVDGTTYRYTREAWLETTQRERTVGEVHTMTMQAERFLSRYSRDGLLQVLEELIDVLGGFGKDKPRPINPRTVRSQNRWLLERPTTDESRAWLLHELTRRIYES
jgi:hypothetical protein